MNSNSEQHISRNEPAEEVIRKIKDLLHSGELQPGSKLPAERKLAEIFGVGRAHVRTALQKLEFYGIVRTFPQSGSVIAGLQIQALESLISDVLKIDAYDFMSLVDTRVLLEKHAIRLCCLNRTEGDLKAIIDAHNDFLAHFGDSQRVEKDFIFHRTIAQGSHNPVLKSLLLIITPDIMRYYNKHRVCEDPDMAVIDEHNGMIEAIRIQAPAKAEVIMGKHLENLLRFSRDINNSSHYSFE